MANWWTAGHSSAGAATPEIPNAVGTFGAVPKVLVAGVSGVVGYAAAQQFAADPAWDVIGVSRRRPERLGRVHHVALDLGDADACRRAAAAWGDMTHLVYAALYEKPGLIPGWYERD
jgi:hypothetical protein